MAGALRNPANALKAELDPRVKPRLGEKIPVPDVDPTQLIQ